MGMWQRRRNGRGVSRLVLEPLEPRVLLSATLSLSGVQALVAGANVNVSADAAREQTEMLVDVNPTNPLNLAGLSHRRGGGAINVELYYSNDGGATWTTNPIVNGVDGFASTLRFDPTIAYDADGRLYVGYGIDDSITNTRRIVVGRSSDGGATFDQFSTVDTGPFDGPLDKLHLATGLDPSTGNQAVYIAYSDDGFDELKISGSNNGGASWTTPLIINDQHGSGDNSRFPEPAVGPNGELYVGWHDLDDDQLKFDRDLDGLFGTSDTFGTDVIVTDLQQSIFFDTVPAQPERGIFTGPVIDVDRSSGPFSGTVYFAYGDTAAGGDAISNANIYLHRSLNEGSTWSSRVLVDAGQGAVPNNSTEFHPWLSVDPHSGSVNVSYYTSQGDQGSGNNDVNIRLATSTDGGQTFPAAQQVNLTSATSDATGGYGGDYLEYFGLAVRDGTAHALWSDQRGGAGADQEAYTASASFNSASNVLTITGDDGGAAVDDDIIIRRSAANTAFLEVIQNGQVAYAGLLASVDSIVVNSLFGDDTLTVDYANGDPIPSGGLDFDGGDPSASDTFAIAGTSGPDTYTVAIVDPDSADITVNGGATIDVDTTELLAVNGRAGSDLLNVVAPGLWGTLVSGPGQNAGTLYIGDYLPVAFIDVEDARINNAPAIDPSWLPVPNAVVLDPLDDTGASNSDNVTSEDEARIFIEADLDALADRGIDILTPTEITSLEPGVGVAVIVNGSRVGYATPIAGTNSTLYQYTFAPGDLSTTFVPVGGGGGLNFVKAAVVVFDGQSSSPVDRTEESEPLMLTLDTTAPATPPMADLLSESDTYDNVAGLLGPQWTNTDNVTSVSAATLAGITEAGATVRVHFNGVFVGTGIASGAGAWEVTVGPIADGMYDISVNAEDLAGNISAGSGSLTVTIDTLAPQRPTLDLPAASDSGVSDSDNITNAPNDVPILVTAEPGSRVLIKNGETVVDDFIMAGASTTRVLTLPEGTFLLSAEAFDVPGNRSAQSEQLLVEIDRTAPPFADADLLTSSDTGADEYDNVTANNQPAFGGRAEAGARIYLVASGEVVGQTVVGSDDSAGLPDDGLGLWEITTEPLDDGVYDIHILLEDRAGNTSMWDPLPGPDDLWIDTQAPNVPYLDLDPDSDDGWHDDDDITSIGNPEVTVTISDTPDGNGNPFHHDIHYRIYDRPGDAGTDGEVLLVDSMAALGDFSTAGFFTNTLSQALNDPNGPPLAEGVHNLKLVAEDRAGNTSESFLILTIDPNAWDLSVARLANGQVALYDADADDPCCSDVDAFDVRIAVNRDNVVTGVDIVGNPTGLGILVMPWGGGTVRVRDLRQLPPEMREDLSFIAIQGSASLVTTKMRLAGWEDLGQLILVPEGVVADPDLDGDGTIDEATGFFATGSVQKFKNWYGLRADVVAQGVNAKGNSFQRIEIWRGGVAPQAEVMTPNGGIGYFSASEGDFAGHMMTAGDVGTFQLTNGSVLTGLVEIGGSLNRAHLYNGATGGTLDVAAALSQFTSHQVFEASTLLVGGGTGSARFLRGATNSMVTLNGDASLLGFGRGMTNTLVTVLGNTGLFRSLRAMLGTSAVSLNGTARTILVRGGIWDSTLTVAGRTTQADIYGAVGGLPGSGVWLGDAGRATFYGDVSADTRITTDLTGRVLFRRGTTGNVTVMGHLLGRLMGRGFADVEILGDFLGRIGGKYTPNGAGTLTLHGLSAISGLVMRQPGGPVLVTGADPAFNGAFAVIDVV